MLVNLMIELGIECRAASVDDLAMKKDEIFTIKQCLQPLDTIDSEGVVTELQTIASG